MDTPPLPRQARVGIPALIFLLTFVAFSPSIPGAFVNWDDNHNFVLNGAYRGLSPSHLAWMFTTFHMGHWQPLSWMTLGLDFTLWGMSTGGYHLTNIFLHGANAVLFYALIVALLRRASEPTLRLHLDAAAGALLFAIHPLRAESVAWITERRDVLSGFFLLLTMLAYLRMAADRPDRRRWYAAALACFALSLMSKA